MLRIRMGDVFLFGLDAENVRRLKDDQPIVIDLAEMEGPPVRVSLIYGDTLQDLIDQVERATGISLPKAPPGAMDEDHGDTVQ